jgi:CheY-like chemotaxis protein
MIFVVDDDSRVRSAAAQALRNAGYEVAEFESGPAALKALKPAAPVRLIISDVQMPEMNGPDFAAAALRLCPELKIQFISGDIGDMRVGDLEPWPLLPKPFTTSALKGAVQAALGPTRTARMS